MLTCLQISRTHLTHFHFLCGELISVCINGGVLINMSHVMVECPHYGKSQLIILVVLLLDMLGCDCHSISGVFVFFKCNRASRINLRHILCYFFNTVRPVYRLPVTEYCYILGTLLFQSQSYGQASVQPGLLLLLLWYYHHYVDLCSGCVFFIPSPLSRWLQIALEADMPVSLQTRTKSFQ